MSVRARQFVPEFAPEEPARLPERMFAGMWRRFFAFAIDGFILAVVGLLIGIFFFDELADLGAVTRLAGFLVAMVYFAICESSVGGGQSIGKHLLGLRVVHRDCRRLTVEECLLRYTVIAGPLFLSGLPLPISRTPWIVLVLLSMVVIGAGGTNLYLLIFNRPMRQGLHDLAAKAYVTEVGCDARLIATPVGRKDWVVAGSIFVVLGALLGAVGLSLTNWGPFAQLMNDVRLAEQVEDVQQASVRRSTRFDVSDGHRHSTLSIDVYRKGRASDEVALENEVAKQVLENDPKAWSYDRVSVTIVRGFDLGFYNSTRTWRASYTPADWRQVLYGETVEHEPGAEDVGEK